MQAIASVMTPCPWTIQADDTLAHARDVMERNGIRHLPVTEDGALVGVVSQREVVLLLESSSVERARAATVRDALARDLYVVGEDEPLARVLATMARRHLGSVLVVRNGRLVGIFTSVDACRSFAEHLEARRAIGPGPRAR